MKRKSDDLYTDIQYELQESSSSSSEALNPISLIRPVSPPPISLRRRSTQSKSAAAQVEAGEKDVEDHLSFFSSKLLSFTLPNVWKTPRLNHQSWIDLYTSNSSPKGHHFVIHQHDHPVAGTHYDLRLQCNETSSVSWAIMYGLPGDPNSRRLNRNATETRIHCMWNHLIETASHQTGSLLIWDTGMYEILPYREDSNQCNVATTDEDNSDIEPNPKPPNSPWNSLSEPDKLHQSFQNRRIRLRLHGTRLPPNYTLSLWLRTANNRFEHPAAPKTRRRRGLPGLRKQPKSKIEHNTDSDQDPDTNPGVSTTKASSSTHSQRSNTPNSQRFLPSPHSQTETDLIRLTNAYTGAHNSINSIHQRRWYLCLDRMNSGFVKDAQSGKWVSARSASSTSTDTRPKADAAGATSDCMGSAMQTNLSINGGRPSPKLTSGQGPGGFSPFYVLGRDHERSVVTGRLAGQILADEGVVGYVPRGKWHAVTE